MDPNLNMMDNDNGGNGSRNPIITKIKKQGRSKVKKSRKKVPRERRGISISSDVKSEDVAADDDDDSEVQESVPRNTGMVMPPKDNSMFLMELGVKEKAPGSVAPSVLADSLLDTASMPPPPKSKGSGEGSRGRKEGSRQKKEKQMAIPATTSALDADTKVSPDNQFGIGERIVFESPLKNGGGSPAVFIPAEKYDPLALPAADDMQFDEEGKRKDPPFKYTGYTYNLGLLSALCSIYYGAVAIGWQVRIDSGVLPPDQALLLFTLNFTGIYTLVIGVLLLAFELRYGANKTLSYDNAFIQYRALMYFVLSAPTFTSYATIMVGVVMLVTSLMNYVATRAKERGKMPKGGYWVKYFPWEEDRGTFYISIIYIALSSMLFYYNFMKTIIPVLQCFDLFGRGSIDAQVNCPSVAAAIAKGFGHLLNINCALLLVPIMRSVLTIIAERINKNNSFPIRKAIEFHQIIASIVGLSTIGHVFFHYVNFTLAPGFTILAFGNAAWFTGITLVFVMVVMYAGAHYIVKRQQYELFWFTHHFYTLFFLLLVAHGPQFYQWFIIPAIMFAVEKVKRHRSRVMRTVYVRSVEFIPPVININFAPERVSDFIFKEGQYLYILCPVVSGYQWHPFSMSSAFGDLEKFNYVSLHIRVQDDPKSWTYKLHEYFRLIAGKGGSPPTTPYFTDNFYHFDEAGRQQKGTTVGPDGRPLIKIDGPYNSPTQMYYSYRHVLLVGSGIGMTPSSGILRAILGYKWNKGFFPETLRFCWLLRQQEAESFFWFIELMVDLMQRVKADRENEAIGDKNLLQINIYVTGANKPEKKKNDYYAPKLLGQRATARASVRDRRGSVARQKLQSEVNPNKAAILDPNRRRLDDTEMADMTAAGIRDSALRFDANDLYEAIVAANVPASEQAKIDPDDLISRQGGRKRKYKNKMEDIWIWEGRPDWEVVFGQTKLAAIKRNMAAQVSDEMEGGKMNMIKKDTTRPEVGVCFCGGAAIGRDLSVNVKRFSDKTLNFRLNQEFF